MIQAMSLNGGYASITPFLTVALTCPTQPSHIPSAATRLNDGINDGTLSVPTARSRGFRTLLAGTWHGQGPLGALSAYIGRRLHMLMHKPLIL